MEDNSADDTAAYVDSLKNTNTNRKNNRYNFNL
jgi:hypothetical protein